MRRSRRKHQTWTTDEKSYLRANYHRESTTKLSKVLRRTPNAIRFMANARLGLSKYPKSSPAFLKRKKGRIVTVSKKPTTVSQIARYHLINTMQPTVISKHRFATLETMNKFIKENGSKDMTAIKVLKKRTYIVD